MRRMKAASPAVNPQQSELLREIDSLAQQLEKANDPQFARHIKCATSKQTAEKLVQALRSQRGTALAAPSAALPPLV